MYLLCKPVKQTLYYMDTGYSDCQILDI